MFKILKVSFPDVEIKRSDLPKLRGSLASTFEKYSIFHNHNENGSCKYRYPLIQYKRNKPVPEMHVYTDSAVKEVMPLVTQISEVKIGSDFFPIKQLNTSITTSRFKSTSSTQKYKFVSPWLGLNTENYKKYLLLESNKKICFLEKILRNNILAAATGLGIRLDPSVEIKVSFFPESVDVKLKNIPMLAFRGHFSVNVDLPDEIGLGKSTSRGFGCIKRIEL